MIVPLIAGRTPDGREVEHAIVVIEGSPASARISETIRSAGEVAGAGSEAADLVQTESRHEHLTNALTFLQSESRRLTDEAAEEFSAAVEQQIKAAASGKMAPQKLLEAFDRSSRCARGFGVLLTQVASRLRDLDIPLLIARASWMERICIALEQALERHEEQVADALSAAVALEGGISTEALPGSFSFELRRTISELSSAAADLRKRAKDLEPREPKPPSDREFFANLNAGH